MERIVWVTPGHKIYNDTPAEKQRTDYDFSSCASCWKVYATCVTICEVIIELVQNLNPPKLGVVFDLSNKGISGSAFLGL
jgi:hypothetical protein